ncbi:MAG: SBBP repeat-containing protein [Acidobacteriota bacterium]
MIRTTIAMILLVAALGWRAQAAATDEGGAVVLQYTSPSGHVIGFEAGSMYVASADHALKVELVGADAAVTPVAREACVGSAKQTTQSLAHVTYPGAWEGVTASYESDPGAILKSSYVIAAGSRANAVDQIRLRYNRPVHIDETGRLVIGFETGQMVEEAPVAWQEKDGKRTPVAAEFRKLGESEVGFCVGSYDRSLPLLIDPALTWNTFLGGDGSDYGYGIALDSAGNIYLVGKSSMTWGTPVRGFSGSSGDAFVAKLDVNGTLIWNTFLGGNLDDVGNGIAVDGIGNVYVVGHSRETWGAPVRAFTAVYDVLVAKLANNGVLLWNTFLGGNDSDVGNGIAVDGSGSAYVTGESRMTWGTPSNPYSAGSDAFAAQVAGNGVLTWNTFLGGTGTDAGRGIATDGVGSLYLVGNSGTTWGSPVRPYTQSYDIFVCKLLAADGFAIWNTFLGGTSVDFGEDIALDGSGNAYVTGVSYATWGAPARAFTALIDGTVAKLSCADGALGWNTFLGGSGSDYGNSIAVDSAGNVYATGSSPSSWGSPTRPYAGGLDAYIAGLAVTDGSLKWNEFLGSDSNDHGFGVAAGGSGKRYVAGYSALTWGSPLVPHALWGDAFVALLTANDPVVTKITSKTSRPDSPATIKGTGFSADKTKNVVYFGTKKATINNATTTRLKVTIPRRVKKGLVDVYVMVNGQKSNVVKFQVK